MKQTANREDVIRAVNLFAEEAKEEGCELVDVSDVNYDKLLGDINAEYNCGADGSAYDIIMDLNDSVGLDDYGIEIG